jgi:hypothetical protein
VKLSTVTVFIEYRVKAGFTQDSDGHMIARLPTWRVLRARVRQESNDPDEPFIFGKDLVKPSQTNIDALISSCLIILQDMTDHVIFEFDSIVGEKRREYRHSKLVQSSVAVQA